MLTLLYCKKSDIHVKDNDKTLPNMYWVPTMHKTPIGSKHPRSLVASGTFSSKVLPSAVSKVFKMIYNHVENFHNKCWF